MGHCEGFHFKASVFKNLMFKVGSMKGNSTLSAIVDLFEWSVTDVHKFNLKAESVYKLLICKTKGRLVLQAILYRRTWRWRWKEDPGCVRQVDVRRLRLCNSCIICVRLHPREKAWENFYQHASTLKRWMDVWRDGRLCASFPWGWFWSAKKSQKLILWSTTKNK